LQAYLCPPITSASNSDLFHALPVPCRSAATESSNTHAVQLIEKVIVFVIVRYIMDDDLIPFG
jgi:hypothetical protein